MNIFKAIFSAPKALDAIINTGDALVFTDEERKEAVFKMTELLGPQNIARRVVAMMVTGVWSLFTLTEAVIILTGFGKIAEFHDLYGYVSAAFGGIMVFYFGAHLKRAK